MTLRLVADAVFTVDSDDTILAPGAIEIDSDGLISWVGDPWQDAPAAGTEVRQLGGLLMPGLRQLPRACTDDLGAQRRGRPASRPLAERVGLATRGAAPEEDVYWGMALGAAEMLCNGMTTTCEQYRHPAPVTEALLDSGMRAMYTRGDLRHARDGSPANGWEDAPRGRLPVVRLDGGGPGPAAVGFRTACRLHRAA